MRLMRVMFAMRVPLDIGVMCMMYVHDMHDLHDVHDVHDVRDVRAARDA
jgi:hypothetical protein